MFNILQDQQFVAMMNVKRKSIETSIESYRRKISKHLPHSPTMAEGSSNTQTHTYTCEIMKEKHNLHAADANIQKSPT